MCRIVGPASREDLRRFAGALTHCGPEGGSIYIDDKYNMGLVRHRLSTIDFSASRWQLGFCENRRCGIICKALKLLRIFYLTKVFRLKNEGILSL